jgi:hypothetical protein
LALETFNLQNLFNLPQPTSRKAAASSDDEILSHRGTVVIKQVKKAQPTKQVATEEVPKPKETQPSKALLMHYLV